jgi:hypothetical protein
MFFKIRRIFVSHSSDDDPLADKLVKELSSRGLKPFVDHHPKTGIIPGEDWLRALRRNLGPAQAVLLLVSDGWRRSKWCQAEYSTAKLLNKAIIPVVIENGAHGDIEPSLQKVILDRGAISLAAIDAIARALPSRILANSLASAGIAMLLLIAGMGVENTPYGRWEAATMRGGTFVDLLRDPGKNDAVFALAADAFGRRGLFSSPDCGNTWSEIALPEALTDANRLDVTADEILVASDNGLWILNKLSQRWAHLKLEGLSETVLVAKVVPRQPDKVIYGTLRRGGMSAGGGVGAALSNNDERLRAREGSGGATILDRRTDKSRSFPFQMNDVAFHPNDPEKIAVAAHDGVFISQDGLATVIKIGKFDWGAPLNVSFDDQGDTVYVASQNGLSSFKFPVSEGEQPEVRHLFDLPSGEARDVAFGRDGRMVLATTVGLFAAETRVAEFIPVVPAPLEKQVNKLLFCGERTLAATGADGVLSISQGDAAWQQVLTSTVNFAAFDGVRTASFQVVFAGPYVFRSLDGGRMFEAILAPGVVGTTFSIREPPSETGSPTEELLRNRSQIARASYLYSKSSILAGFGQGKILRKPPGSLAWIEAIRENPKQAPVNTVVRSATNPKIIIATFQDGQPMLSEDDGETWVSIDGLAHDQAILAFALEDGRYLLSAGDGKLRTFDPRSKTVTTGSSISQKPIAGYTFNPARRLSIVVDIGGDVYSLEKSSLELRKIGKVPVSSETDWINLYCCDEEKGMYLGGKSMGLLRSLDGGERWEKLKVGALRPDTSIYALGPGPAEMPSLYTNIGLLQVSNQGKLCISDTNCLSWTAAAIVSRASMLWERLREGVESMRWTVRNTMATNKANSCTAT